MASPQDLHWMRKALELAQQARGLCQPNPMVGAVVVKDGRLVGEGYHHRAGEPHAEPNALADAGEEARGATLYVTLEPCSTQGRTPPCTQCILKHGIARVVFGSTDANPAHRGAAVPILESEGVQVEGGVLREECDLLNEDFFWYIVHHRPFVTLKMAMTLDGRIATASGDSRWITGPESRSYVQELRRGAGAVMVGGSTVELDNPSLSVREPPDWPRQPRRLVWSARPIPAASRMYTDGGPLPERVKPVTAQEWQEFLNELGKQEVLSLLLEGGGELAAAALRANAVNKVCFFIAPKILGGRGSRPAVGGDNPLTLAEALPVRRTSIRTFGADYLLTGYLSSTACSQD
ncbi:MAG: bifunctional diaminohydroxyphosphoribosylaminopyrimidine deaminase/5-amino-6-(5-phosphoribosylamino)uracil reductase RibD [Victivallales bacterium]|nr:bifunctional diaminohydroxyphosphoribosylaminopyrimidine deaminase/5-amino-6-(5-phosphoribosylamino)uracil reductase RibD [Victivallales bacterium]